MCIVVNVEMTCCWMYLTCALVYCRPTPCHEQLDDFAALRLDAGKLHTLLFTGHVCMRYRYNTACTISTTQRAGTGSAGSAQVVQLRSR